ncbi:MAG: glutaminyl-peptide cyclotransferase [Phycisphaerales bacterium]|nr:MAG: glutaminyl-peptide cyclotransferase [Phycisphaerales bacterium]
MNRFLKLSVVTFAALLAAGLAIFALYGRNSGASRAWTYEVVNTFAHDPNAFTQGLVFEDGFLYEGTGLNGQSELRKVELETGDVLKSIKLADKYFGEGITILGDRIYQLTYRSKTGFVYDKETFERLREFTYPTEGWGLTHDGERLIMSDGTPMLYFLDPNSFKRVFRVMVLEGQKSIWWLNELEFVEGQIYANVWPGDRIARIEPDTGRVLGWIDCAGLLDRQNLREQIDVFNGIAYDPNDGRLFVTGKNWPNLFEIKTIPAK